MILWQTSIVLTHLTNLFIIDFCSENKYDYDDDERGDPENDGPNMKMPDRSDICHKGKGHLRATGRHVMLELRSVTPETSSLTHLLATCGPGPCSSQTFLKQTIWY